MRAEADKKGAVVHMGYILGFGVEKNSEMEPDKRTHNGRVVLHGNIVVEHSYAGHGQCTCDA